MGERLTYIGDVGKGLDQRKSISISLHFASLNRMPCCDAKVPISIAIMGSMHGMTSKPVLALCTPVSVLQLLQKKTFLQNRRLANQNFEAKLRCKLVR